MKKEIIVCLFFIYFLSSCSNTKFNHCLYTENNCFYINKELNFFHKTEKNNLIIEEKNKNSNIQIKEIKKTKQYLK